MTRQTLHLLKQILAVALGITVVVLLVVMVKMHPFSMRKGAPAASKPLPPPGVVRLSPAALIPPERKDLQRLAPHLWTSTGAVKVEYAGPNRSSVVAVEVWEDGQRKMRAFGEQPISLPVREDLTISLTDDELADGSSRAFHVNTAGLGTSHIPVTCPSGDGSWETINLPGAIEVTDADETAVWAYVRRPLQGFPSTMPVTTGESPKSIQQVIEDASWAVVIKISFQVSQHGRLYQGD